MWKFTDSLFFPLKAIDYMSLCLDLMIYNLTVYNVLNSEIEELSLLVGNVLSHGSAFIKLRSKKYCFADLFTARHVKCFLKYSRYSSCQVFF